jgi:diguanylate cyclase (GGDEF)-like protein/PAS domain S-box-containing protein
MNLHDIRLVADDLTQPGTKLHIILNNSSDAFLLLDRSLSIVVINRAAQELARLLLRRDFVEGALFLELIPANRQADFSDYLQRALAGETITIEKSTAVSEVSLDWYELQIHPARQDNGQIIGVVIEARLITDRKTSETGYRSLYESEKEQRRVAEALQEAGTFLSQSLDYGKILDGLLEQVAKVVQYDLARIYLYENRVLRIAREHFISQTVDGPRASPDVAPSPIEYSAEVIRIIENQEPILNNQAHAVLSQDAESKQINSWIGVPIQAQDQVIAVIWLEKFAPDYYRQEHILLLSAFAGQAALALQNALLFDSIQRRVKEAETLRQAAAAVTSELGLNQVLDRILISLKKVVHYDRATIYLLNADQLQMVARSGFSNNNELTIGTTFPSSSVLFQESVKTGRPLVIGDATQDPRFDRWAISQEIRGWLGIPLHLRGRVIGYMALHSRQVNAYSEVEATLAQAFANEATIALENARLFQELQNLAIHDQLTGIWNRHHFFHLAKLEYQRARRQRQPLSAILFDLDSFKSVNDTYGHAIGDQVLQGVAQLCRQNLRQVDILGRYGGEEFMVLLPNTPLRSALQVAERLCGIIAATAFETDRGQVHVSASFGIAEADDRTQDIDALLKSADQALYFSKEQGKNRVAIVDYPGE